MAQFTLTELADMHLTYGEARCSGRRAAQLYSQKYPTRVIPHKSIFQRIHHRLLETGSLRRRKREGDAYLARTVELEEAVLQQAEVNPCSSVRSIGYDLGAASSTVWRILREQQLYPYRLQKVQTLDPQDYPFRRRFCRWWLQQNARRNHFAEQILFTDEATFTREGIFNSHNSHVWEVENPHAVTFRSDQHKFAINIWAGIVGDHLIGPYLLPPRLTGAVYQQFLQNVLPDLLDDVPLIIRRNMWFQHDGAPAHFSMLARQYLTEHFPNRWIGRGGPVHWPARSPDLNPLDFFLWGHIKSLVYETRINTEEELIAKVLAACTQIQTMPGIFQRVRTSMNRRAQLCLEQNGKHFEQFL